VLSAKSHGSKRDVLCLISLLGLALWAGKGTAQNLPVEDGLQALGKGPTLGVSSAPVTIVEFSDFQCSFCKKFWAETLPKLAETYIRQGKARFIYRHFAILGKHSLEAAQGAECAGEEGKFWEYHDRLFANQGGGAFREAKLKQYARDLNLNVRAFSQCLESGKYLKKIEGQTAVASFLGARGTPTFFINRRRLVGAQPFEVFKMVLEEELKSVSKRKSEGRE